MKSVIKYINIKGRDIMEKTFTTVRAMVRTELTDKEYKLAQWLLQDQNNFISKDNWNKIGKDKDGYVPIPYEYYGCNVYRLARMLRNIGRHNVQVRIKSFMGSRQLQFRLTPMPKMSVFR